MPITDRIIFIIGGATGIGRATATLCAQRGARVIIADVNETAGKAVAASLHVPFHHLDVTREDEVAAVVDKIAHSHGQINALIQTAGILQGAFVPIEEFEVELFRRVLDVNTVGSFLCAKYAAPLLRKSDKPALVLISSGAAHSGSSSYAYGASKGGVSALGITLANKLAPEGIRVNVVCPGGIQTPMKLSVVEAEARRDGRNVDEALASAAAELGNPIGIAQIIAFLVSPEADYMRGSINTR